MIGMFILMVKKSSMDEEPVNVFTLGKYRILTKLIMENDIGDK